MSDATICGALVTSGHFCNQPAGHLGQHVHTYQPILDNRRLEDELAEARRILNIWRLKFQSGNPEPVKDRMVVATDIAVRDTRAFFEKWPA